MSDIMTRAVKTFHEEETDLDFADVCTGHMMGQHSYIVRTASFFLLAREVGGSDSLASDRCLIDDVSFSRHGDNLHVTLAVGDMKEMIPLIPSHIRTLSFQRRGYQVHRMNVRRFVQLAKRG